MRRELLVPSKGRGVYDITSLVEKLVRDSGAERGVILLFSVDPLTRFVTVEYEGNLVQDLMSLLDGMKTSNPYVLAALFHPSLAVPFERGLLLGAFQQICLLDLNEKEGERRIVAEVVC